MPHVVVLADDLPFLTATTPASCATPAGEEDGGVLVDVDRVEPVASCGRTAVLRAVVDRGGDPQVALVLERRSGCRTACSVLPHR